MKNKIIITLFSLLYFGIANSQHPIKQYDCGTWVKSISYTTEWKTIDTIWETLDPISLNKDTLWTYDEWRDYSDGYVAAVHCPCGCGWDKKWYQKRVSDGGIVQKRWKTQTYKYVPKPESPYEKKVREIKNQKTHDMKNNFTGELQFDTSKLKSIWKYSSSSVTGDLPPFDIDVPQYAPENNLTGDIPIQK